MTDGPSESPIAPPIPGGTSDVFLPVAPPEPVEPVTIQVPVQNAKADEPPCPICGSKEYAQPFGITTMRICANCHAQYTLEQAQVKADADKLAAEQKQAIEEQMSGAQNQDAPAADGGEG